MKRKVFQLAKEEKGNNLMTLLRLGEDYKRATEKISKQEKEIKELKVYQDKLEKELQVMKVT